LIADSLKHVRYNPEIRVEGSFVDVPAGKEVLVEDVRNIPGELPGFAVAVLGIQPQPASGIYVRLTADRYTSPYFASQAFQGLDEPDQPYFLEASKNLSINALNRGASDVSGYMVRTTWAAYSPDALKPLIQLPSPVWERFDLPAPPSIRAVLERCFETARREYFSFYGDLAAGSSATIASVFNTRPGEIMVVDSMASAKTSAVVIRVYREGETKPGAEIRADFLPSNLRPVAVWLPAKGELMVEAYASAAVAGYVARIGVRWVRPASNEVLEATGLQG